MSLRNPTDLADRLGQKIDPHQIDLMERFAKGENPLEVRESPAEHTLDAVALCALWRMLLIPGSKCFVIAANTRLEGTWLDYMKAITQAYDPAIASICRWPRWNTLKIGDQAGGEMWLARNHPMHLAGFTNEVVTWVILGARSAEPRFVETRQVAEGYKGVEGHRHIVVW